MTPTLRPATRLQAIRQVSNLENSNHKNIAGPSSHLWQPAKARLRLLQAWAPSLLPRWSSQGLQSSCPCHTEAAHSACAPGTRKQKEGRKCFVSHIYLPPERACEVCGGERSRASPSAVRGPACRDNSSVWWGLPSLRFDIFTCLDYLQPEYY